MRKQAVNKLDSKTGEILATYETIKEAAEKCYTSNEGISACINGRAKTAGDCRWEKAK